MEYSTVYPKIQGTLIRENGFESQLSVKSGRIGAEKDREETWPEGFPFGVRRRFSEIAVERFPFRRVAAEEKGRGKRGGGRKSLNAGQHSFSPCVPYLWIPHSLSFFISRCRLELCRHFLLRERETEFWYTVNIFWNGESCLYGR